VLEYGHQDDDGAAHAFEQAVVLGPTHPEAYWLYGEWLLLRRRFDEAIDQMQKAVQLDPVDFVSNMKLGWALLVARRYDRAINQLTKTVELKPDDFAPHKLLAFAYEREDMSAEAAGEMHKSLLIAGDTSQALKLRQAYEARGVKGYWQVRRASLLDTLTRLQQRARRGDEDLTQLIWTYAELGDRKHAFELLDRIADDSATLRGTIWIWLMDSLRSDPRFGQLVRKAGLPLLEGER
jgi:predicted Zn-dependent protease